MRALLRISCVALCCFVPEARAPVSCATLAEFRELVQLPAPRLVDRLTHFGPAYSHCDAGDGPGPARINIPDAKKLLAVHKQLVDLTDVLRPKTGRPGRYGRSAHTHTHTPEP